MHVYRLLDGTTQALSFPYVVVGEAIFIILGGGCLENYSVTDDKGTFKKKVGWLVSVYLCVAAVQAGLYHKKLGIVSFPLLCLEERETSPFLLHSACILFCSDTHMYEHTFLAVRYLWWRAAWDHLRSTCHTQAKVTVSPEVWELGFFLPFNGPLRLIWMLLHFLLMILILTINFST